MVPVTRISGLLERSPFALLGRVQERGPLTAYPARTGKFFSRGTQKSRLSDTLPTDGDGPGGTREINRQPTKGKCTKGFLALQLIGRKRSLDQTSASQ